jgi:hypothetical protein
MKKTVRLTESDLIRLVKKVIKEQEESEQVLKERIKKTFGINSFCNVNPSQKFPYNGDVKKLQLIFISQNRKVYPDYVNSEKLVADGILGKKTLSLLCPR